MFHTFHHHISSQLCSEEYPRSGDWFPFCRCAKSWSFFLLQHLAEIKNTVSRDFKLACDRKSITTFPAVCRNSLETSACLCIQELAAFKEFRVSAITHKMISFCVWLLLTSPHLTAASRCCDSHPPNLRWRNVSGESENRKEEILKKIKVINYTWQSIFLRRV